MPTTTPGSCFSRRQPGVARKSRPAGATTTRSPARSDRPVAQLLTWWLLGLLSLLSVASSRRPSTPARPRYSGKRLRALCHERERTGKLAWCLEDFLWFASLQTMPDLDEHGETQRFVLEPHLLLIAWEVFVKGRVELLAMLPKGNGKTAFFAALAVFHLLTVRNASCYIGAADAEQAGEMFRFAVHYVESSTALRKHLRIGRAQKIIRARRGEGFIKVLASDNTKVANKKQGYNPTLALIDELHAHDNDNMYVDLRSGVTKRPGRLIVIISTAGTDPATVLGQLLARILRQGGDDGGELVEGLTFDGDGELVYDPVQGRLTVARAPSGRSVALIWALRPKGHPLGADDPLDFDVVKLANPASWVTRDSIEDGYESLPYARYLRWRCNLWAQAEDAKIPAEAWDGLETGATIPDDAPVLVVVDYARKSDSTCATQLWLRDDGKLIPEAHVWALEEKRTGRPQPACHTLIRGERTIRQSLVREHIRSIRDDGREVLGVVYDPHLFDPEELSDEGFLMIEFPQTDQRMVPASKATFEAICGSAEHDDGARYEHDGDPVLRAHVTAAGTKPKPEDGYRFSKSASEQHIDAMITLVMGTELALAGAGAAPGCDWGD
jgi:phage terminase large subunit-like protein